MNEQIAAAHERCVLYDLSPAGRIFVSGPDAAALLAATLTCEVPAVPEQSGRPTLLCNESGGVIDAGMLYRQGAERWLLLTSPLRRDEVRRRLQGNRRGGMDLRIDDRSETTRMPAILGPGAKHAFTAVLSGELEQVLRRGGCREIELNRTKALLTRAGFGGDDGFEFVCSADAATALRDHFLAANVVECGADTLEVLRIEAGIPAVGWELGGDTNPWEAGLDQAISLESERTFEGRAALEAMRQHAPRSLTVLRATGPGSLVRGAPVLYRGKQVASLTSAAPAAAAQPPFALAYLPHELGAPGTPFTVGEPGAGTPVEAVQQRFDRPRGAKA